MVKGKKNKKRNLLLRRQLRRTVGCLFMISAIIIAAIPVQPVEANPQASATWIKASVIDSAREVADNDVVFYTKDARFQFAYKGPNNDKGAVIAGYTSGTLPNNRLVIPDVTDGYVYYFETPQSPGVLVASDTNGNPLFYQSTTRAMEEVEGDPVMDFARDAEGNPIIEDGEYKFVETPQTVTKAVTRAGAYMPCTVDTYGIWHGSDKIGDPDAMQLFIKDSTDPSGYKAAGDTRVRNVPVKYISGNAATIEVPTVPGTLVKWTGVKRATGSDGVFAGGPESNKLGNATSVEIGNNMLGIGDYAFYYASNLLSIKLGNGVSTLGNHAFENCIRMQNVDLALEGNLATIGCHAFANCTDLASFSLPYAVQKIGDGCFQNNTKLAKIHLVPEAAPTTSVALKEIGYYAFEGCSSLTYLQLPESYSGADKDNVKGPFHLSTVRGCTSLAYITTRNRELKPVTDATVQITNGAITITPGAIDGSYAFVTFKTDVGPKFYFEGFGYVGNAVGAAKTPIHQVANDNGIAFSYLDPEFYPNPGKFEIVKSASKHDGTDDDSIKLAFAVNKVGELTDFQILTAGGKPENIILPENIGPYGVVAINAGSFSDNCYIEKITLPESLQVINAGAFKGTHNLKHIIFNKAEAITSIGAEAFWTQDVRTAPMHVCNANLDPNPYLSFSGTIEDETTGKNTEPFKYAMKASSNINRGTQPLTYITYYSGFPTNLTVQYNHLTGENELIDYPRVDDLNSGYALPASGGGGSGGATARGVLPAGVGLGAGGVAPAPVTTNSIHKNGYQYPYITKELSDEAISAIAKYEAWLNGGPEPTEIQRKIAESAVYNMVLFKGITSIKPGLFSGVDASGKPITDAGGQPIPGIAVNNELQTLTTRSINQIDSYTFSEMAKLKSLSMSGGNKINSYAVNDCDGLENVEVGPSVSELGIRPFIANDILKNVTFPGSSYFLGEKGLIYGLGGSGSKNKVIQCLPTRGGADGDGGTTVGPEELAGITSIAEEAFMNCDEIGEVDLSQSKITGVPKYCFADYGVDPGNNPSPGLSRLSRVVLPDTTKDIWEGAFWNTNPYAVVIPSSVSFIAPDSFSYAPGWDGTAGTAVINDTGHRQITFICLDDSPAAVYASHYPYINTKESDDLKVRYTFWIMDAVDQTKPTVIEEVRVIHGEDVPLPDPPKHEGYTFSHWYPPGANEKVAVEGASISAFYTKDGALTHTVEFIDYDDKVLDLQIVEDGKDAKTPAAPPAREGYNFTGWRPEYTNVKSNLKIYAQYEKVDPTDTRFTVTFYNYDGTTVVSQQRVAAGESAIEPAHPTRKGYTFTNWQPATAWKNVTKDLDVFAAFEKNAESGGGNTGGGNTGGGNTGDNGNNNNNNNNNTASGNSTKKYKATVNSGNGSGEYTPGTVVNINAYATADGKVFDRWVSSSSGVGFANSQAISSSFTMPANDVEITATYKDDTSGVSSNKTRNTLRNAITTVDVNKSGISNTGLASAVINGTNNDGYVVKITEDPQATAAIVAALEAKYGDLSNIAYLPMDISIYDSSGQVKITDVGGITVDITLPLPDALASFGTNNKVGSELGGKLEDLGTTFTMVNGVPCVKFTATHFSPYVVYVDKGNLTEGTIDATPKTGDPIHPKWFLAIGLACIAVILFAKKDRPVKVNTA